MAYLDDHPPASPQFRYPRREPISGEVFVHSAESIMDDVGVDTGAENVAGFISRRSDPGSYHVLVDSDSLIDVVRDECESFQVAAGGHNRHGWGISLAASAHELNPDNWWTRQAIGRMGQRIRQFWYEHDVDWRQARWGSRAEAEARVHGAILLTHGDVQPSDRSDAWTRHPRRPELDRLLLDAILGDEDPTNPHDPIYAHRETDMIYMKNADGRLEVWGLSPDGSISGAWESTPGGGLAKNFTIISPADAPKFSGIFPVVGQESGGHCPTSDLRLAVNLAGPYGQRWAAWQDGPGGGLQVFPGL